MPAPIDPELRSGAFRGAGLSAADRARRCGRTIRGSAVTSRSFRSVTSMSVPASARIKGAGTVSGDVSSPNASIDSRAPSGPSGCQGSAAGAERHFQRGAFEPPRLAPVVVGHDWRQGAGGLGLTPGVD